MLYYAASSDNLLPAFRDNQSVHEHIGCTAMSVRNYHYTLRKSTEEHSALLLRGLLFLCSKELYCRLTFLLASNKASAPIINTYVFLSGKSTL